MARAASEDLLGQKRIRIDSSGNSVGRVGILRDSAGRASAFVSSAGILERVSAIEFGQVEPFLCAVQYSLASK